jgi:hypothetical protein
MKSGFEATSESVPAAGRGEMRTVNACVCVHRFRRCAGRAGGNSARRRVRKSAGSRPKCRSPRRRRVHRRQRPGLARVLDADLPALAILAAERHDVAADVDQGVLHALRPQNRGRAVERDALEIAAEIERQFTLLTPGVQTRRRVRSAMPGCAARQAASRRDRAGRAGTRRTESPRGGSGRQCRGRRARSPSAAQVLRVGNQFGHFRRDRGLAGGDGLVQGAQFGRTSRHGRSDAGDRIRAARRRRRTRRCVSSRPAIRISTRVPKTKDS